MKYNVVVFGVKDTSENIIDYMQSQSYDVDLVVTIAPKVTKANDISGYKGLSSLGNKYGFPVYEAESYGLNDEGTKRFFADNEFDIGIFCPNCGFKNEEEQVTQEPDVQKTVSVATGNIDEKKANVDVQNQSGKGKGLAIASLVKKSSIGNK